MTIKSHQQTARVLDGPMGIGCSNIVEGSLTVDGGAIPAGMVIDYISGTAAWSDQNNLGDRGPYLFEYDYDDSPPEAVVKQQEARASAQAFYLENDGKSITNGLPNLEQRVTELEKLLGVGGIDGKFIGDGQ